MKKIIIIILVLILILISFIGGYFLLKPKTIIITFNTDGGTKVNNIKIIEENKIKLPNTTKDGYEFDGWYIDDKKIDDNYIYTTDTLLKAKWKKIITYQVIFNSNGGSIIENIVLKEGETFIFPSSPEKEDYNFIGWKDENGNYVQDNFVITKDILLIAEWEYKYYCNNGYKLENKKCTTVLEKIAQEVSNCPEGYLDLGKGMCFGEYKKVPLSEMVCPENGHPIPDSRGECYIREVDLSKEDKIYESWFSYHGKYYWEKEGARCKNNESTTFLALGTSNEIGFYCGGKWVSGDVSFKCPTGYTLKGAMCYKTIIEEAKIKK